MYICSNCWDTSPFKLWICPKCWKSWTFEKQIEEKKQKKEKEIHSYKEIWTVLKPKTIKDFKWMNWKEEFLKLDNTEMLRVFQNWIMKWWIYLLSWEPWVGKSTMLLQIIDQFQKQWLKCWYFSWEENELAISKRSERLWIETCDLFNTWNFEDIIKTTEHYWYDFIVIDSIQTTYTNTNLNTTWWVSQIKAICEMITSILKKKWITALIIWQINKNWDIAWPEYLQHMVDCVVNLEWEKWWRYKFLRSSKNRYWTTDDVWIFEMTEKWLQSVTDYQKRVAEKYTWQPWNVLSIWMDNWRPILVNIEVLLTPSSFNFQQRSVIWYDKDRLNLVISILEKYLWISLKQQDIFLNIPWEISFKKDIWIDLWIAAAIYSAYLWKSFANKIFIWELTLMWNVQECSFYKKRKNESKWFELISHETISTIKELIKIKS